MDYWFDLLGGVRVLSHLMPVLVLLVDLVLFAGVWFVYCLCLGFGGVIMACY